jgi:NAD(P)-dependent dehydrogenase (short-subunit alcohol dehydrogenase family)
MYDGHLTIVTGANGGIARACIRRLGTRSELVLTDASPGLEEFAGELALEGFHVREAIVGDFRSTAVMDALERHASQGFSALIHSAGLPPGAPWRDVFEVNYVATAQLLKRITPHVGGDSVAVLMASVAGHLAPPLPDVEKILADPDSPRLLDELEPVFIGALGSAAERGSGTLAYVLSKKKVMELCESHAPAWGARGGRIVSISPGMTFTTMGRDEAARDEMSEAQVKATPIGRWATASEIAEAVSFLLSPSAGFITGTDLRIDGGAMTLLDGPNRASWFDMFKQRLG